MSTKIWFKYIVQNGDNTGDLDYVNTSSLTLNGGAITPYQDGISATLTLPTPGATGSLGANKDIVVATTSGTNGSVSISLSNIDVTISGTVTSISQTTTYTEDTSAINNPERGLHKYTSQSAGYSTSAGTNNLSVSTLNGYKNSSDKVTVIYRYYLVPEFINSDINTTFLNNIQTDFDNMRTAGIKCIFRISYSDAQHVSAAQQPSKAQILTHISQFAPVLEANKDVILTYQAGYIGTWGEWYYTNSTEFGTDGSIDSTQLANRKEILDAMIANTPMEISLQMRYPSLKRSMYGTTGLTSATAYQNTAVARLGFFNDAMFNNWGDQGFFSVGSECTDPVGNTIWNYVENENKYTLYTGENNGLNPCNSGARTSASNVIYEAGLLNLTILNRDFESNFWAGITGDNYTTILKNLGYRFVLESTTITTNGLSFDLTINLRNDGFARVIKNRPVYLILKNTLTNSISQFLVNSDIRTWDGNVTINQNFTPNLTGEFDLYLWMPDVGEDISSNSDYSIRLANTGTWDSGTGYNDLLSTISLYGAVATLPNLETNISGSVGKFGTSNISLQNLNTSISGTVVRKGTSNITLQNINVSSNGTSRHVGTSNISLRNIDTNISGKKIYAEKEAFTINTSQLSKGIYLVKTSEGIVEKLIVK
jgi:hypothetical protein